ncbi:MAG: c-type cytochrome [Bacteroidetes bacterium]|nr:c-type cytochrome [Bacteroidota bacterium]
MKTVITIFAIAACIGFFYACSPKTESESASNAAPTKDSLIKRGAYLVTSLGCSDCHSPKKFGPHGPYPDTALDLSGCPSNTPAPVASPEQMKAGNAIFSPDLTAFTGPWGTSFAANITSDATGVGNWKLEQFKNAIRNGKYMGLNEERPLMPPMPWKSYAKMTDMDIEAIFDYLKTTKPVHNVPPSYKPPGK